MEKYPVKPGTVVQLPHRQVNYGLKKQPNRRKAVPLEEQVALLKQVSRRLALALAVSIVISLGTGYVAVTQYLENRSKQAVGQNYSLITTEEPTTLPADTTAETTEAVETTAETEEISAVETTSPAMG